LRRGQALRIILPFYGGMKASVWKVSVKRHVIGLDLGGTNIVGAVVDDEGQVVAEHRTPTQAESGAEAVLARLIETGRALLSSPVEPKPCAVGVGSPGGIDAETGRVVFPALNIPGWEDMPLAARLSAALELPAFADNDVNVTALGEAWFGAGSRYRDMVCITIGTGIGGGVVIDRRVHHGANHFAGEIGHTSIDLNGRRCVCGSQGCVETYAAAPAIAESGRRLWESGIPTRLREMVSAADEVTAADVAEAAASGDAPCRRIIESAARCLGAALANVVNILNPECIVIGGGVAQAGEALFGPLREEVRLRGLNVATENLAIVPAALGERAGVGGAAALALQRVRGCGTK